MFKSAPTPQNTDVEIMPPPPPLVGAQGYQRFHLSEPVVGQNLALHAVPAYRASTYQVFACEENINLFPICGHVCVCVCERESLCACSMCDVSRSSAVTSLCGFWK